MCTYISLPEETFKYHVGFNKGTTVLDANLSSVHYSAKRQLGFVSPL